MHTHTQKTDDLWNNDWIYHLFSFFFKTKPTHKSGYINTVHVVCHWELGSSSVVQLWWFTQQSSLWAFCLTRIDNEWAPIVVWALSLLIRPLLSLSILLIFGLSHPPLLSSFSSVHTTIHFYFCPVLTKKSLSEKATKIKKTRTTFWVRSEMWYDDYEGSKDKQMHNNGKHVSLIKCVGTLSISFWPSMCVSAIAFIKNIATWGLSACCSDSGSPCLLL